MNPRSKLSLIAITCLAMFIACSACGSSESTPRTSSPDVSTTVPAADSTALPNADQAAVLEIVNRQGELVASKDWRGLWDTFSPQQHAVCPYDKFLAAINGSPQSRADFDVSRFAFEQEQVRIEGDHAFVTYIGKYDGRVIDTASDANPDVYVRIDGKWYDEVDSHAPFGC
jgi:hypothetical protein